MIRTLRDLQKEFLTLIKDDLSHSFISLSSQPDRLINLSKNSGDLLDQDDSSKKGGKGNKKDTQTLSSLDGFEIPQVDLIKYRSACSNTLKGISDSAKNENTFRLKGTLSVQVYLNVNEKTTVKELIDGLI